MNVQESKKTKILFLVPPQANMFDVAGAAQVFHEAREHGLPVEVDFCSFEEHIKASTGIPLGKMDLYSQKSLGPGDYLFIVSADIHYILSGRMNPEQALYDWIIKAYNNGAYICSICIGAFLLGRTGLLNHKQCTTHWKRTAQLQHMFPLARVEDNILFTEDERIISSAGATSGVDVALHILSRLKDEYFTYKISRELVIYNRRSGSHVQHSIFLKYRNHVHAGIHKVQDWLVENIDKKVNMPDLADIAMMSERNFTRVFKKETQLTVNEFITRIRKEKIREFLKNPDLSRDEIARLCGLQSVRHLSRLIHSN